MADVEFLEQASSLVVLTDPPPSGDELPLAELHLDDFQLLLLLLLLLLLEVARSSLRQKMTP